jgi:catechol 2,3-dioxygenase-like lactoylglutathione lyase family enzyme
MAAVPGARYVHTNLIARDWRRLVRFYVDVFGCVPVPPERDLGGDWLARLTGIAGAALRGVHLRLPGFGDALDGGPTLEIFQYSVQTERSAARANTTGLAHLAFAVDDVAGARAAVLAHGGSAAGDVVAIAVPGRGQLTAAYVCDPEGNLIELQRWG